MRVQGLHHGDARCMTKGGVLLYDVGAEQSTGALTPIRSSQPRLVHTRE
jgi:hypothetical protein